MFALAVWPLAGHRCLAQVPEEQAGEDEETSDLYSIDREELEDLAQNPVDINVCSEGDLMVIPWLSRKTAAEIIKYRTRMQGFWRVEELLKVKGVTQETFDRIAPYVTVMTDKDIKTKPFRGDIRFRLKADEPRNDDYLEEDPLFQHPLYLYNRTVLRYGNKYETGFVMRRDDAGLVLSAENIQKYFLVKNYLVMRNVYSFDKIIIGNYYVHFNQGLVFYYPFNELIRPVKGKPRGVREDKGTGINAHQRGIAVEKGVGPFHYTFFYSDKPLIAAVNEDGTCADSLVGLRNNYGYFDMANASNLSERYRRLREKMFGGKIVYNFLENSHVGLTAFHDSFDRALVSSGENSFGGKINNVAGMDFETWYKSFNLVAEWAQSGGATKHTGMVWLVQPMFHFDRVFIWTTIYDYDPNYFNQHASGYSLYKDNVTNEQGFSPGVQYKGKKTEFKVYTKVGKHPELQGSHMPWEHSEFFFDIKNSLSRKIELYFREWEGWDEQSYEGKYTDRGWKKTRIQLTWTPSDVVKLRTRWDQRREELYEYNRLRFGHLIFGDVKYRPTEPFTIDFRVIYFDAAEVYMSSLEFIWPQVLIPQFWAAAGGSGEGVRFYVAPSFKLSKDSKLWIKYENTYYLTKSQVEIPTSKSSVDTLVRSTLHSFKVQYDLKW